MTVSATEKHGVVSEACQNLFSSVDSREAHIRGITTESESLFDNRREILIFVNMDDFGIGYYFCSKYFVGIARLGWHQAVCGKED